jgi:uncharacterized protein (TIGR03083 family)
VAPARVDGEEPGRRGRGEFAAHDIQPGLSPPASTLLCVANDLDYLAHLARDSARFAEALRGAPPAARVPACPDWNADDLLWHLAEVQWFWGTIVRDSVTRVQAEERKPARPADRASLLAFYQRASSDLGAALAETPADAPRWTWADDQTAGFIRRRQAQEALIHRVDAELTAGGRTPMDPRLSADGVDEALRVMFNGDVPDWGTFTLDSGRTVGVHARDTGGSWFVTLGRFTGTDPGDQQSYDEPSIRVSGDPGEGEAASVTGSAADLDCWLWQRPPLGQVELSGDEALLSGLKSRISEGIN